MVCSPDHVGRRWFDELRVPDPGSTGSIVVFAGCHTEYACDGADPRESRAVGEKSIGDANADPGPGVGE